MTTGSWDPSCYQCDRYKLEEDERKDAYGACAHHCVRLNVGYGANYKKECRLNRLFEMLSPHSVAVQSLSLL